ncbi:MAG: hypothetical protein J6J43_00705 [Oscillospiraceae bacterium]|nr:hypothetical protein [Oscillospiraceae bacterium]
MEEPKKSGTFAKIISAICLVLSICLLIGVCGHCYPQIEQTIRQAVAGVSDNPVQEAFGVLADGLGESRPVKEVLSESYGVLIGEAD